MVDTGASSLEAKRPKRVHITQVSLSEHATSLPEFAAKQTHLPDLEAGIAPLAGTFVISGDHYSSWNQIWSDVALGSLMDVPAYAGFINDLTLFRGQSHIYWPSSSPAIEKRNSQAIQLLQSWLDNESEDPKAAQKEFDELKDFLDENRPGRKLFS